MKAVSVILLLFGMPWGFACKKKQDSAKENSYVMPYVVGKTSICIQGNGSSFSHNGNFYYAFDFDLSIGDTVTAARAGVVVSTESRYVDGNRTPGEENYVVMRHQDGTYGRYFHLTKNGALVKQGDRVQRGQPIGLSGDTGNSARPHLHFDVTASCALPAPSCQTIEIAFVNCIYGQPITGNRCKALPY